MFTTPALFIDQACQRSQHPSSHVEEVTIPQEVVQAIKTQMSQLEDKDICSELFIWDFAGQVGRS